ncbi:MAG TPA: AI-2E family transporter, partial [Mobilitalea sp.]|nr:AI-2E family transporter [Mobilitalea sp.]
DTISRVKSNVMPNITSRTITFVIIMIEMIGVVLITFVAALLIAKDVPVYKEKYKYNDIYRDVHKVTVKLADAGIAYLRTQFIIMVVVAFFCVLGLTLIRNEYALLLGLGIAFLDALPILGDGLVFIPWSIIMLLNGNIYAAAILISTYLINQVVREVLEPKLLGNRIGVRPIFTLISMYVGLKLFSIAGFILGPIGLIIIITVVKVVNEKTAVANAEHVPYNED